MLGPCCEKQKMFERGHALLALVEETELCTLVGVYDGKNTSDALADVMNTGELRRASGDLASPQRNQIPSICQHSVTRPRFLSIGNPRFQLLQLGVQLLLGLAPQLGGLLRRL